MENFQSFLIASGGASGTKNTGMVLLIISFSLFLLLLTVLSLGKYFVFTRIGSFSLFLLLLVVRNSLILPAVSGNSFFQSFLIASHQLAIHIDLHLNSHMCLSVFSYCFLFWRGIISEEEFRKYIVSFSLFLLLLVIKS